MLPSNYLTASQTHELVESGDLTIEKVIEDHRARIEERDKDVLAWTYTNVEVPPTPLSKELCGITIGVKDIMSSYTCLNMRDGADIRYAGYANSRRICNLQGLSAGSRFRSGRYLPSSGCDHTRQNCTSLSCIKLMLDNDSVCIRTAWDRDS